ncbi:MAG: PAS domain-containing protein [Acidobacteriia bacterium]|nr:PAS domain-containing protein [Terriglobia bacterium]
MNLTPSGYVLIGLTALIGCLVAVLTFALLRIGAAARDTRRALRGEGGMETALLSAALQDAVAKLKAQERAMAARADASERLSGEIIASLTAGVIVAGLNGELRVLNPAGRRMFDLPDQDALDECRRVLGAITLWAVIDECLNARTPIVRRSITLPERRGGVSHLGVTVSPLFDGAGQLHGAICLFTDLTAIKDLEEQVRLKHSLAAVGELTAGIAHEFRNGLATIHGYSKLFDLQALPEAYRPYVEGIRAEAESLGDVVTNFLNFARPAHLTLSRVDLRAICERAADDVRADARGLGGSVDVRGEFAVVDGDEVLLRQAFSNLLRNALEACAGQGIAPRIVIQSAVDARLRVSRISVDDNGPGIAPSDRDRVFQPFFTSKRNGTGLGLALVQKIIVFHNGRVTASAAALGGASLQVTLPLAE